MSLVVGLPNNSYKPVTNTAWVRAQLCKLQKECTRLVTANDKVYQLLAKLIKSTTDFIAKTCSFSFHISK
jgi:hypothetical protein